MSTINYPSPNLSIKIKEPKNIPKDPQIGVSIVTPIGTNEIDKIIKTNPYSFLYENLTPEIYSIQANGLSNVIVTDIKEENQKQKYNSIEIFAKGISVVHITNECREIIVKFHKKYISLIISPTSTVMEIVRSIKYSLKLEGDYMLYLNEGRRKKIPLRKNTHAWNIPSTLIMREVSIDFQKDLSLQTITNSIDNDKDILCFVQFQNIPPFETIIQAEWNEKDILKYLIDSVGLGNENIDQYELIVRRGGSAYHFEGKAKQWNIEGSIIVEVNKIGDLRMIVVGDYSEEKRKCLRVVEYYKQAPTEDEEHWAYANRMSFTVATSSFTKVRDVALKFQAKDTYMFIQDDKGNILMAGNETLVGNSVKIIFIKSYELQPTIAFCKALEMVEPFEEIVYRDGDIIVTKYRTIVSSTNVVGIPHSSIAVLQMFTIDNNDGIFMFSKDFQKIIIIGSKLRIKKLLELYFNDDFRLLYPRNINETYAFRSTGTTSTDSEWRNYNYSKEFKRIGILNENGFKVFDNSYGKLSMTYPQQFVIPEGIDVNPILQFRSKGRIPIICWRGKQNQTISRSAQPSQGLIGKGRCEEDEMCLKQIIKVTKTDFKTLSIYDARPSLNAQVNRFQGGGIESVAFYPFCVFQYLSIENIHDVRKAYYKLIETVLLIPKNTYEYKTSIENSKWYQYLHSIVHGAVCIANKIKEGSSVLIHCSDGWDRTSQLASISMMLLDPFYRTIEGFLVLIEKEWITVGHMFKKRSALGASYDINLMPLVQLYLRDVKPKEYKKDDMNDNESSPIYAQFIECVEIIRKQSPNAFEFNMDLLIFLLDSLYTCQFANYLEYPNSSNVNFSNLPSIMPYIHSHKSRFINSNYKPVQSDLSISLNPLQFMLWEDYYLRNEKPTIANLN